MPWRWRSLVTSLALHELTIPRGPQRRRVHCAQRLQDLHSIALTEGGNGRRYLDLLRRRPNGNALALVSNSCPASLAACEPASALASRSSFMTGSHRLRLS